MQFVTPEEMQTPEEDWDETEAIYGLDTGQVEEAIEEVKTKEVNIDSLAELDFSMPEQTILPDVGFNTGDKPTEASQSSQEESFGLPPLDEDIVIEIAPKKVYKRPGPKLAIALVAAVLVCGVASQILSNGVGSVSLTEKKEDGTVDTNTPETAESEEQINNEGKLKSQIASSNLAQEVEAMNESAKDSKKKGNATSPTTASVSSSSSSPSVPPHPTNRIVYGGSTNPGASSPSSSSSLSSRSYPVSSIPASQVPPLRSLPVSPPKSDQSRSTSASSPSTQFFKPSQTGSLQSPNQTLTIGSFGALPENQVQSQPQNASSSIDGFQTVALNPSPSNSSSSSLPRNNLLAQQQDLFLSGKKQTQIRAGQLVSGKIQNQVLAQDGSIFYISTTGSLLGLPAGTMIQAMITGTSGSYINAEGIAIVAPDGTQSPLSPGAVTVGASNGKLLKASSNKGFLQSQFGQALLGAGQGLASEFTSRSETFSQSQFGSTFSREGGNRDLGSLASGAIKGLTDPLLSVPSSSETALTLNPGTSVQLAINSSFYFAP